MIGPAVNSDIYRAVGRSSVMVWYGITNIYLKSRQKAIICPAFRRKNGEKKAISKFSMQEKTTVCGSCPEAGALYFQSNNMPWEQAALQCLLACTLIEIFLVFQDLSEELCLYFGLAHSHYCVKVGQIKEYMVD